MPRNAHAWVVGTAGDVVVDCLPRALRARGWTVSSVEPSRLADLSISVDQRECRIDGAEVHAIVFRTPTNAPFSASYCESDRPFADAETRAVWLAALNLPSVLGVNRLDAVCFFETEHWTVWRRTLKLSGLRLTPANYGVGRDTAAHVWVPFSVAAPQADPGDRAAGAAGSARFAGQRFERHLLACSRVIGGEPRPALARIARALARSGVELAEVATGEDGELAWVNSMPEVSGAHAAELVDVLAARIAEPSS